MRKRLSVDFAPGADAHRALTALLADTAEFAVTARLASNSAERLAVVVEELVSNVARHGAAARSVALTVDLRAGHDGVALTVEDDGPAFDPTGKAFAGPDQESGGGVGIELVRRWCDAMHYVRDGNRNRVELHLPPAPAG